MSNTLSPLNRPERPSLDFFEYWDSFGLFDELQVILPPQFFVIFEIARVVFTPELISEALSAIEDISHEEKIEAPDRDESILYNRMEKISPVSDHMEIDNYRTIFELKKALPREPGKAYLMIKRFKLSEPHRSSAPFTQGWSQS